MCLMFNFILAFTHFTFLHVQLATISTSFQSIKWNCTNEHRFYLKLLFEL